MSEQPDGEDDRAATLRAARASRSPRSTPRCAGSARSALSRAPDAARRAAGHARCLRLARRARGADPAAAAGAAPPARRALPRRGRDRRRVAELDAVAIAGVMVGAWVLVALIEWAASRADRRPETALYVAADAAATAAPTRRGSAHRSSTRCSTPAPSDNVTEVTRLPAVPDDVESTAEQQAVASTYRGARPPRTGRRLPRAALPDRHLRDLLPGRPAALVADDAVAASLAAVHHRRELRLLRLVGLAVRLPARRLHALEPGARGPDLAEPLARRSGARCSGLALAGNLGVLGYFKYYDFFVASTRQPGGDRRPRPAARARGDRAAGRHLLLHVHGDQLRRRRLPGRVRADDAREFAVYLSFFPHLVAGPIVRAVASSSRSSRRRATRVASTRAAPST